MERFIHHGLRPEYVAPYVLPADITIQAGSEPEPVKINSAIKKNLNHKPNPEAMILFIFSVDGEVINSIGKGLCVLVGITRKDKAGEMDYLAKKIVNIRLWDDDGKKWDKSVKDLGYEILCISQFTLALEMKGNKPDFHDAMNPEYSEPFYNDFLDLMRSMYKPEKVKGGVFGGYMQIHIQNDGPVTIPLDTPSSLQDPNFLLKQERKQEAARKRDQKSKDKSESKNSDKKSSTITSQEPPSDIQQTSDSLKNVSLSQEET